MAQPALSIVTPGALPDPPYPPDTGANGWHPELHLDRIYGSDTWTLAEDDERPWLLRIWCESWRSMPVGSMPSDRRLFARRIGCRVAFLDAHSEILTRGWVRHSDGLLYHGFIAGQVVAMLEKRRATAKKVSDWRAEKKRKEEQQQAENGQENVTGYRDTCNRNVPVSNRQEQEQEQEQDKETPMSPPAEAVADVGDAEDTKPTRAPPCPYAKILESYGRTLPELSQPLPKLWPESKSGQAMQSRWRENPQHQALEFWEAFFSTIRTNDHWMGKNGWKADLHFFMKKDKFYKVIELMVNLSRNQHAGA